MSIDKTKLAFVGLVVLAFGQIANSAIMSEEVRLQKIEATKALLGAAVQPVDPVLLAKAPSPFSEDLGNTAEVDKDDEQPVEVSDEELLPILAKYVQPTGIFQFGGDHYLIFKEKKLKSGSELGVMYNGTEYRVTIAEITRNTFSVQLGEAQLQLKLK